MKILVFISPKKTVSDPQGHAVKQAIRQLGYCQTNEVRIGKVIELEVEEMDPSRLNTTLKKMCHEFLSNPLIEDYRYEVVQ